MEKVMKKGKGQKHILFLFLIGLIGVFLFTYPNIFLNAIKAVHSNVIIWTLEDYQSETIGDTVFYYRDIDEEYIHEITNITNEMVKRVNNNLKAEDIPGFNVVVYPNSVEMNQGLRLSPGSRTLGAYYGGNIFLLSPSLLEGKGTSMENTILHEYAHLVLDVKTNGNYPTWFSEGVALYQEYLITGYEWGENRPFFTPYTIEQLERQFYQLDQIDAYRDSYLRVRFLTEEYGEDFIFDLIEELRIGRDFQISVERLTEKEYKVLENQFLLWIDDYFYGKL